MYKHGGYRCWLHTGQANPPPLTLSMRKPPAFSAIRRCSEGGRADGSLEGGLKRIFGVDGGAEGSLRVWKQSGCNTISVYGSV